MKLKSTCCNAEDQVFRRVLNMNFSEMGICPNCGEHCDFESKELIKELLVAVKGKDMISVTIRQAIENDHSHIEIIEYIKSQAKDNIKMMSDVIGVDLITKIIAL